MAWFSKAFGGKIESHKQKLWAVSRCNFAASDGQAVADLGVYKRDPSKHPDEPNLLPDMIAKAQRRQIAADVKKIMGRKSRSKVTT